jgi:hypothetical protein
MEVVNTRTREADAQTTITRNVFGEPNSIVS